MQSHRDFRHVSVENKSMKTAVVIEPAELEAVHFDNFVTARVAKSVIPSKYVFNPYLGFSKLKLYT